MPDLGPLNGVRVIELAGGIAGPHAGKLLADYGAQVTKIEPPGGDRARHFGPFKDGIPHPETSAPFLWFNTSKRSIVADVETDEGRALLRKLLAHADVLIDDLPPGKLASLGLAQADLVREFPGLVVCSITPFGQDGPYANLPESDIVLQAMGGAMYNTGAAEREPLRLVGEYALWHAGLSSAFAIMLAVLRAEATGHGEVIDASIYESQAGGKDRRQLNLLGYAYTGNVTGRGGAGGVPQVATGVRKASDGYISLLGFQRLAQVAQMIGRDDLAARPEWKGPADAIPADLAEDLEQSYAEWALQHTMREGLAIAQEYRILGGAVYTVQDVLADPNFRERGAFERIEHPVAGDMDYPARPAVLSASPKQPSKRAPLLDEHRAEVLREAEQPPRERLAPIGTPELPLKGIRVIDLAIVWAGPFAAQLLAEWGAEVIRMEPVTTLQPQTRSLATRPGTSLTTKGVDPWNADCMFNSSSHNKRSFAGDMKTPEGREAFLKLVAVSDVIVENNVPDTIDRLGISYDELRQVNPRLIFTRMPGFGLTGAYRDYRAWGSHIEAMAGYVMLRAYDDLPLEAAGSDVASDSVAGLTAAFATAVALRHRAKTGEGQLVEMPQVEAFMSLVATDMLDHQMNGTIPGPRGNDHTSHAPHNAYPTQGSDRWIAIDVGTDEQWHALCEVLGLQAIEEDPRFADQASRWKHRKELDAAVATATSSWNRWTLFDRLVAAGVPAGPVQDTADCFHCRHLRERQWFRRIHRDDIGSFDHAGSLFRFASTPNPFWRAAVRLGEDNEYVYREVLQYSPEAYQDLVDRGLVDRTFAPSVLQG